MTTQDTKRTPGHSPGPYGCELDHDGCDDVYFINGADDTSVAQVHFWDSDETWANRAAANARLLTAAPDMLDALKALLAEIARLPVTLFDGDFYNALHAARIIVEKAEGSPL